MLRLIIFLSLVFISGCTKDMENKKMGMLIVNLNESTSLKFLKLSKDEVHPKVLMLETEVTNKMYDIYLKDVKKNKGDVEILKDYRDQKEDFDSLYEISSPDVLWKNDVCPEDKDANPVVLITAKEAHDFCSWLTKKFPNLGTFRLPTKKEWLLASYGDSRQYPWGNKWNRDYVKMNSKTSENVASRPKGKTPTGIYGMFGNVNEYVVSSANIEDYILSLNGNVAFLGGSYKSNKFSPKQEFWGYFHDANKRSDDVGFRVLLVLKGEK